jgi:hypothetical protein
MFAIAFPLVDSRLRSVAMSDSDNPAAQAAMSYPL